MPNQTLKFRIKILFEINDGVRGTLNIDKKIKFTTPVLSYDLNQQYQHRNETNIRLLNWCKFSRSEKQSFYVII